MTIAAVEPDMFATVLANNIPIIIAALTIIGGIIAAKVVKPPTYAELVAETRALRADRSEADEKLERAFAETAVLRAEFEQFKRDRNTERDSDRRKIGVLLDGMDAAWSFLTVLKTALRDAGQTVPEPSEYVSATMEAARAVRLDEHLTTAKASE